MKKEGMLYTIREARLRSSCAGMVNIIAPKTRKQKPR
jgi:hypothetical protein